MAPAKMIACDFSLSRCNSFPRPARIKENSPICAKLAEIVNAVLIGCLKDNTIPKATIYFPKTMIRKVPNTAADS